MKNNNYTSFFKTKPKKVERYIRCRKCGGNMEWSRDFPPQIKCTKCGYTVYPEPYEPDCTKLPETWEKYSELYEKIRRKNELNKTLSVLRKRDRYGQRYVYPRKRLEAIFLRP